jgi:hypothetical protein
VRRAAIVITLAAAVFACSPDVPERETAAAQLYVSRCGGCHDVHSPASMTAAMWEMQVDRMQGELARKRIPPLSANERAIILDYLRRHSARPQANS